MNARVKDGARAAGFMAALSITLITCIAALSLATAGRVKRNAALFLQKAVMEVAGETVPDNPDAVAEWFSASVKPDPPESPNMYRVYGDDKSIPRALVYKRDAQGLWGSITAVVGFDPMRQTFLETRFIEHNETPGLGARISEEWFTRQTAGKTGPFKLVPEGTGSPAPTEIDAVTGATVTSSAVRDMLNKLLQEIKETQP
ncbi:MAG: FMN-binding protein [Kiritimatiellae bacterium]|nr:FMN-binding protein [Kiritimatiellia bacterium]MDD3545982.1 FMN-binding protein [Kiritimatiellia bacterium]MDD4025801.1 FMN-binding protein [Kiritimatiellia bacterium]MDD4621770.1 FMN-binding protein [Kiritimatiellia bacterium]